MPISFLEKTIPIIKWSSLDSKSGLVNTEQNVVSYISCSIKNHCNKMFALPVNPAISSYYQDNTIIIAEHTQDYGNTDLLLVSLHHSKQTIKMVKIEGNEIYLQSLSDQSVMHELKKENTIIFGIVRETRITQKSCYND